MGSVCQLNPEPAKAHPLPSIEAAMTILGVPRVVVPKTASAEPLSNDPLSCNCQRFRLNCDGGDEPPVFAAERFLRTSVMQLVTCYSL